MISPSAHERMDEKPEPERVPRCLAIRSPGDLHPRYNGRSEPRRSNGHLWRSYVKGAMARLPDWTLPRESGLACTIAWDGGRGSRDGGRGGSSLTALDPPYLAFVFPSRRHVRETRTERYACTRIYACIRTCIQMWRYSTDRVHARRGTVASQEKLLARPRNTGPNPSLPQRTPLVRSLVSSHQSGARGIRRSS